MFSSKLKRFIKSISIRLKQMGLRLGLLNPKANLRKEKRTLTKVDIFYKFVHLNIPWATAKTIDLSENGACILSDRCIGVGEMVELEIPQKGSQHRKISRMVGRVVWVDSTKGRHGIYKHGISFDTKKDTFVRDNNLLWRMADKHCYLMKKFTKDCTGRPAQSLEQIKEAYHLLYKEYVSRNLCEPHSSQLHCTAHSLLPKSRTFILKKDHKLLGTISLVPDSPGGVPMDAIFQEEIQSLRQQGRLVAEVGMLALNSECFDRKHHSFRSFQKQAYLFKLFKTMFDYARFVLKADDLIIGVHPKHQFLYEYLNFVVMGPVRNYSGVCGKPAVLMRMDIETVVRNNILLKEGPGIYFLHDATPQELFERQFIWSSHLISDFVHELKPMWTHFNERQKAYLYHVYPSLNKHLITHTGLLR